MEVNIIVLLIGAAFFLGGIVLLIRQLKSEKNDTLPVTATVTGYFTKERMDSDAMETITYYPIMRYSVDGKWYEEQYRSGTGKKKYDIGTQVKIVCDPQHPEDFIIAGEKINLIMAFVALLIGVAVILLAFFGQKGR